ncbi:PACE efflux transporter [Citricoccus sp. GCM10030269]|uniref:PACE efflux transporter n=1 Tax=Citricoccus sp. GCM10030269 TaxID=3273388 RepID=UPI0036060664
MPTHAPFTASTPTVRRQSPARQAPMAPGGRRALVRRPVFPTPAVRRVVYAVVFEGLAIGFTTVILALLGNPAGASAAVGVTSSVVALLWNLVFNTLFERWERRSGSTGRPVRVRLMHTLLFETGLVILLVPAVALLLQVSLVEAFLYEAALIVFFLIYNAAYAWCFDRVFGLPESAQ